MTGIGTPSNHNKIPLPMTASRMGSPRHSEAGIAMAIADHGRFRKFSLNDYAHQNKGFAQRLTGATMGLNKA